MEFKDTQNGKLMMNHKSARLFMLLLLVGIVAAPGVAQVLKNSSTVDAPALSKQEEKKPKHRRRKRKPAPKRNLDDKQGDYEANSRRAAPRDAFPVFDNPKMSKAKDAKTAKDEAIIGVVCNGEARAYPISIMGVHELGNDVCGKTPIAVAW